MLSRGVHKILTGNFASSSRNNTPLSKRHKHKAAAVTSVTVSTASTATTTTSTTTTSTANQNRADADTDTVQHTTTTTITTTTNTTKDGELLQDNNSPRSHSKGKQTLQEFKADGISTLAGEVIEVDEATSSINSSSSSSINTTILQQPPPPPPQPHPQNTTTTTTTMTNDRFHNVAHYDAPLPQRIDVNEHLRPDTGRATPADPSSERNWAGLANKKKKSTHAFYNEAFAVREAGPQIPDSVGVMVEFKTNVILDNEFEFIKSLSQFIAKRYSRAEECVALTVDHSACMIMGGTFDGCYFVTITSPTLVSPTCNKRNVALLAEWVNNAIGVPASRGYIRFVETDIANYAVGGITGLDVVERERAVSRAGVSSSHGKENSRPWSSRAGGISARKQVPTYANGFHDPNRPVSDSYTDSTLSGRTTAQSHYSIEKQPVAKRGRSMFGLFGRSQKIAA